MEIPCGKQKHPCTSHMSLQLVESSKSLVPPSYLASEHKLGRSWGCTHEMEEDDKDGTHRAMHHPCAKST